MFVVGVFSASGLVWRLLRLVVRLQDFLGIPFVQLG